MSLREGLVVVSACLVSVCVARRGIVPRSMEVPCKTGLEMLRGRVDDCLVTDGLCSKVVAGPLFSMIGAGPWCSIVGAGPILPSASGFTIGLSQVGSCVVTTSECE